jgi:hypothetical protein
MVHPLFDETSKLIHVDSIQTFQVSLNDMYRYAVDQAADNRSPLQRFLLTAMARTTQTKSPLDNSPGAETSNLTLSPHRKVRFHETVHVISIPSRHQYSDRIKQCVWTNRIELREMSQRNHFEFEYENYDWNQVILENQMYLDSITGSLIHPCHFHESTIPDECYSGEQESTSCTNERYLSRSDSLSLTA